MATSPTHAFARDFRRLAARARRAAVLRAPATRALVRAPVAWEAWRDAFNALHHAEPHTEARVARALAAAAGAAHRPLLAARFTLLEGRGLLRHGLPGAAGDTLARAAVRLRAVGEPERAAQALVAAVDALGHAGRLRDARVLARRARAHVARPGLVAWRDFLAINHANVLRLGGDLAAARRGYERAARNLERRGDAATAAIARLNAAVTRLESGEAEEALSAFEASAEVFRAQGRADMEREARYNVACAQVRCGRLGRAVRALEALASEHDAAGPSRRGALCRMDLADALLRAGDAVAAEREATRAAAGFRAARAAPEEVEALWLAAACAARRDARRGARLAREAERRARRAGRPGLEARCALLGADLALRAGKPPTAAALRALERKALRAGQHEIAAQARLLEAATRLAGGRPAAALARLRPLGAWRAQPLQLAVAALTLEAQAERALGRTGAALRALERACAGLAPVGADLPGAWLRAAFLLEHLDPWLTRVDLLLERGRPADREAAETLLEGLAQRRFLAQGRVPAGDRRARALRARLEALYDRLGRGAGPTRGAGAEETTALLAQAQRIERALAEGWRLEERRRTRAGRAARAATRGTAEAVLHLWRRDGRVFALLRQGTRTSARCDLGPVETLRAASEGVKFHARRLLLAGGAQGAFHAALGGLAERVLAPLLGAPLPARLALVADPDLPDLPLEVLPWQGAPLASRTRFLRAPAARLAGPARPVGVGVAWIAVGEADLPGLAREAAALAPDTRRVQGAAATREALREALARCARVHVAGHGYAAAEAPALGGVRLADGWFGAADLPPSVGADVVVLAACRTGRAGGPAAQAWGGLATQLLAAGARRCLWTADDVEDAAAAEVTARFDASLRLGEDVSRAFGMALDEVARQRGHVAALLPFRLSGLLE